MSARARTDVREVGADISHELKVLRKAVNPQDDTPEDFAMCAVETFIAVALRVFAKTNPSKVRSEAMNVELQARLDSIPVVRGVQ